MHRNEVYIGRRKQDLNSPTDIYTSLSTDFLIEPPKSLLKSSLFKRLPILENNLLTCNQHNHHPTHFTRPIMPLMIDSRLHDKLSRPHSLLLAPIQPQHDLPRNDRDVVQAQRPVHGDRSPGLDVGGTEEDAGGGAAGEGLDEVGW